MMYFNKFFKALFGGSDDKDLPVLRGKINLLFFILFPIVLYKFLIKQSIIEKLPFTIFSVCAAFNFLSSIVLHWRIWDQEEYSLLRKIDYAGIFLMIGGSGLPAYSLLMINDYVVILALVHWLLIFTGVFSSLLYNFCYTTKMVRSIVYLIVATPYYALVPLFIRSKNYNALMSMVCGGVAYTLGGLTYGLKFPNLIPGVFEYHELFHVLCLLGFSGVSIGNFFICKDDRTTILDRVFDLNR